ncbi:hypothetical protein GIB67_008701 [Kingdonia uniflora]|uniref:SWIM-type domain-containing protein n=1 Tax=Kingdonia uniflora TaxID=39325 RepID=A0A7J7NGT1_9MAGN|nr:hypothetical protein GIB67_008701 [Kingdonia uniflora]
MDVKEEVCEGSGGVKSSKARASTSIEIDPSKVTDYISGENDKFKVVDGEYLCYINLLNAIIETVDHKCGKTFYPARSMLELHCNSKGKIVITDSDIALTGVWHNSDEDPTGSIHFFVFIIALAPSVPRNPRVMHETLERDPNNMANFPRKKTLAMKTVPRNKVVRLRIVVGNVTMSQVMGDMTVSHVMGDVIVSQVMGNVTIGSGYIVENVISRKKTRATKKDKRKNTKTNGQNQPFIMKKNRLRPSELLEEELDHLSLFYVSDDDNIAGENVEVVSEWYDNDIDEDNVNEGGHDVDMGWDNEDIDTQDGDGIPNEEDIRRCEVFGDFLNGANNIFEEEEDIFKPQPQTDYESLHVGIKWPTVYKAREYLRKFTILNEFQTKQVKNESSRLRKVGSENELANTLWIANEIEELVRDVKTLTPKDVQTTIKRKYGVNVSYYTAWNAKIICTERITRSFHDGYNRLPELTRQVLLSNFGSIATWSFQYDTKQWTDICLAFKASLDGFVNGCRPTLSLDGCFLKGKYGGHCLSIVALDGNNGLFLIAIYLCRSEHYETWHTFLTMLAPHLTRHQRKLTFISYRQKGLIKFIAKVFPHQNHRFFFRHMWKNFKKDFKGSYLDRLCWGAAKDFVKVDKEIFLDKLQVDNPEAKRWLDKEPAEYWCRSHFDFIAKYKPLDKIIEGNNLMMAKLTYDRRVKAQGWDQNFVVPRTKIHIDMIKRFYNKYEPQGLDFNNWVVISKNGKKWKVNQEERTCDCNEWHVTELPCVHAYCVISYMRLYWVGYCSEYHIVSFYVKIYSGSVLAISDPSLWDKTINIEVLPLPLVRGAGRHRKVRRKGDDEGWS